MQSQTLPAALIVEDEYLIRMDAVDMIRDAGFKTYDASSADQAIVLMDLHPDIGILFTDIDMPGSMDGLKLASYVRHRWPPVIIIVASGATGIDQTMLPTGASFFPKPYQTSLISQSFRDIASSFA
ncbi:Response regulator receiver domain-containing protein [Loktanella atrilutea]|uniref:Response regulator receiver domain-containing protein n=1 Tax=Loktanella atrilutea TaxID=366533 RepID=A0A1M5EC96_LOKAT|nr:response regulator [Loktanella atrilutea]SHF76754.1 Response regulator receiver domain-containing protein [Loktanella atrilutea]